MVVLADADIDQAAGVLIVKLAPKIRALKIGAWDQLGIEMGPLVAREHCDKVKGSIDLGV
ncbi:hypothetical protein QU487_03355 [Crenobacter sp. SG2305]|uniref:hypothetical protein n=1 Tax=Crenobacter oryzisoli TaxID=3056844 RepID=UPI0025AB0C85|nr:hypothetical protein [Crenobacter sp. SG2305]MDN0081800.1 hypothetical protein [Crenobacter sp. SG2305]